MPKAVSNHLHQLIQAMDGSEKRYFKLKAQRESGEDCKYLRLFGLIEKQAQYKEAKVLEQAKWLTPGQLPNLKVHLYQKLLQALTDFHAHKQISVGIRNQISYAEVLYNKSLYTQCNAVLEKARKKARQHDILELLLEILKLQKQVLNQVILPNNQRQVNEIIAEVQAVNQQINQINQFSNLYEQLNAIFLKIGFIRDIDTLAYVEQLFEESMPAYKEPALSFWEKIYLYNLLIRYYFFVQNFMEGRKAAEKWVILFDSPSLRLSHADTYIKALNLLMVAQYKLKDYHGLVASHKQLKNFRAEHRAGLNENLSLKLFKYTYVHEFNRFFLLGDFSDGVALINRIKNRLEQYISRLDQHSRLILYYKIACLYFGNNQHREVIFWLNKIINQTDYNLREDLHAFARIINLISHYELGNTDVIDYYIKSTYRFLLKKGEQMAFHHYILHFLKNLSHNMGRGGLRRAFAELNQKMLALEKNDFEKRAFMYFDIISWLESKLQNVPIQQVLQEKARHFTTAPEQ